MCITNENISFIIIITKIIGKVQTNIDIDKHDNETGTRYRDFNGDYSN